MTDSQQHTPSTHRHDARVRMGLIGFGAWGAHHARAIGETPGAQLVAIAARSDASQKAASEACPGAEIVDDYRRLLDRQDIDAVDIVVPTYLHEEMACAALRAGKHVLLEKPMTASVVSSLNILHAARDNGRKLALGFELRMSNLWGRVKSMIDRGAIGEPQYCLIELWRKPYRLGSNGWRYDISRVGNWILEEPIHFFDLARWYLGSLGEPTHVTARAKARDNSRPELTDNFSAMMDFAGGAYAVISQTLSGFEHHQVAKVTGSDGSLWASWSGAMDRTFAPQFSLKHHHGDVVETIDCGGPAGEVFELVQQMGCFVDAVLHDHPLHATGEDGIWAVHMCEAAAQSARDKQTIQLKGNWQ